MREKIADIGKGILLGAVIVVGSLAAIAAIIIGCTWVMEILQHRT